MGIEIRPIEEQELEQWLRVSYRGFGVHLTDAEMVLRRPTVEVDRALAAVEDGLIVGTTLAHSLQMTAPGGRLATPVVDAVTVQPTHRRRGILTQMIARQLRDFHERGEALSALVASESSIYGRFGFGIGSPREDWTIARAHTAFADPAEPPGHVRFVDKEEAREMLPAVYDRVCTARNGMISINEALWDHAFADPEHSRGGATASFYVTYEEDGRCDGFAAYRMNHGDGTLRVDELYAATDNAYGSLWRYCLHVDLVSSIRAMARVVDEPLPWMLADPRRLERSVRDQMWLRLVDVRAALSSRRYMQSGRVVLEVQDTFCPWNDGRIELEGGPAGAECHPTQASLDLSLSAADLAAVYLGAVRFRTLAHAGRVEEHTPRALQLADTMFATPSQPWTPRL